jgi:ABC-2 type transport system permease protein
MNGAYAYLVIRSLRNRLGRQLVRLRRPRYLIALLLGLGYLYVVVVHQRPAPAAPSFETSRWAELLLAAGVMLAVVWAWVVGSERRALAFSPAEVTFLFAGPVTRRELVRFKLLVSQTVVLFNVVLWTFLLSRERLGVSPWLRALSLWVLLTTLSLHRLGASFVRTSLLEHGRFGARRRLVSLTIAVALAVTAVWAVADALPALRSAWRSGMHPWLAALAAMAEGPIAGVALAPFRLAVRPLVSRSPGDWLQAILPALLLLGAHFLWVLRADAAFEETAAEVAFARARAKATRHAGPAPRSARTRIPLPRLAPLGPPAVALAWKNTVAALRSPRTTVVLTIYGGGAVFALWVATLADAGPAEAVGWLSAMWSGLLVVAGPQWVRNDLRGDLLKLDLLRSYPLRGSAVVAAETASSALLLTGLQLGLLVIAWLAFLAEPIDVPGLGERTVVLALAISLLPVVNVLGMLIHNGAAILLPGWTHLGSGRPSGVEALGQNMLVLIGFAALLGLVLVPPAAVAAGLYLLLQPRVGLWVLLPAAAAVVLIAGVEGWIMVRRLGAAFERLDPATMPAQQ